MSTMVSTTENELAAIRHQLDELQRTRQKEREEIDELRQTIAALRSSGHGNGIPSLDGAQSSEVTDRRGMLKKVAGLAAGVATVGLLRPVSGSAKAIGPDATGGTMIIGNVNSPTNPADVTVMVNPGTALFDNLFLVENFGAGAFPHPGGKIALSAYSNNQGGTPTSGNQYAFYALARAPAGGLAVGAHAEGDNIGLDGIGIIGVRGTGSGSGCGVDGIIDTTATNGFAVRGQATNLGVGGVFFGGTAALGLFPGAAGVANPNATAPAGAFQGHVYVGSTNASVWYHAGGTTPYRRLADSTTAGALTVNSPPQRIIDTRNGSGFFDAGNHYVNDTLRLYDIASLASLPTGARSVVARITVVGATAAGVIQASPNPPVSGNDLGQGTAVVNYPAGSVIPSFGATLISNLNSSGQLRVRGFMAGGGQVDVIIDIVGYYL